MREPPRNPIYPRGTVRDLLASDLVSSATREALAMKLHLSSRDGPMFFDAESFALLQAVCARLVPQDGPERVDIAIVLDGRLGRGERNGWRYDDLPPDEVALPLGLAGVDETAKALFVAPFRLLGADEQDATLRAIERGDPPGATWHRIPASRWFEELLVEATEIFYAHPFGQEEIGYAGMADARGWTRIGLGEREPHEPRPLAPGVLSSMEQLDVAI